MTPIQLREELLISKRSHDDIETILVRAMKLNRSKKVQDTIAAAAEVASDASSALLHVLQQIDESADPAKANALCSMEACANALNLCLFLFEQIGKAPPSDLDNDATINSFATIGKQTAGAAEEAAWNAVEAMGKEASHG